MATEYRTTVVTPHAIERRVTFALSRVSLANLRYVETETNRATRAVMTAT